MKFLQFPNKLNVLCEFYKILKISSSSAEQRHINWNSTAYLSHLHQFPFYHLKKCRKDALKISKIRKLKIETAVCIFAQSAQDIRTTKDNE